MIKSVVKSGKSCMVAAPRSKGLVFVLCCGVISLRSHVLKS
jgi:hypothetical protein